MNAPHVIPIDETALMIRRQFRHPPQRVFDALTRPELMMEWYGPGNGVRVTHTEADLRVGGNWAVEMLGDGGKTHNVKGAYVEIDPPHKVVFTWAWYSTPDQVSRVTFALKESEDGGTSLTLTHERLADSTIRDSHGMGWTMTLNRLVRFVETGSAEE